MLFSLNNKNLEQKKKRKVEFKSFHSRWGTYFIIISYSVNSLLMLWVPLKDNEARVRSSLDRIIPASWSILRFFSFSAHLLKPFY